MLLPLMGDHPCYEAVHHLCWPGGVTRPHRESAQFAKRGMKEPTFPRVCPRSQTPRSAHQATRCNAPAAQRSLT
jgi:hypothetical protein